MKLVLFNDFRIGVVRDGDVVDASECVPEIMVLPSDYRTNMLIKDWPKYRSAIEQRARVGSSVPLGSVRLRAPVPRPAKLLCGRLSFREGVAHARVPPGFFLKSPSSIVGPNDIVELNPVNAAVFHHEAELAVVIGRRAKNVTAEQSLDHVFGYTCFIDISARGVGAGTGFEDKSYDTFGPMGPWIVTADEAQDMSNVQVRLWDDEQLRHDYNMTDIANSIGAMIAYASSIAVLEPGDVLALGVNHQGLGPIQDGETLRIKIEKLGEFEVKVSDPLKRRWVKDIDHELARYVRRMVQGDENLGAPMYSKRLN